VLEVTDHISPPGHLWSFAQMESALPFDPSTVTDLSQIQPCEQGRGPSRRVEGDRIYRRPSTPECVAFDESPRVNLIFSAESVRLGETFKCAFPS
jgi:hypothetical protein